MPDALELLLQIDFVDDGVRGEAVQAVAAKQRLAPLFGLERRNGLAERAGVRRQDAPDGVAHANELRALDRGDHLDVVLEEHRQADRLAELAIERLHQRLRRPHEIRPAARPDDSGRSAAGAR